jgi:hypothetical protein
MSHHREDNNDHDDDDDDVHVEQGASDKVEVDGWHGPEYC